MILFDSWYFIMKLSLIGPVVSEIIEMDDEQIDTRVNGILLAHL